MATLHVRNVPDELYERLRARAGAEGRSIGAEVVQLLEERLAPGRGWLPRPVPRPGRRRRGPGFVRFTTGARQVVVEAQDQAHALGHDHVGTDHLLLGVLRGEEDDPAVRALQALGLTFEGARAEVERRSGPGEAGPTGQAPFRPEAKKALELALREMLRLGDDRIGPVHILLGIVREGSGPGAELIRTVQPDADEVRDCVLRARATEPVELEPAGAFSVVELEGTAAGWEEQLNDAAERGYELVEIVGTRAIFRAAPA